MFTSINIRRFAVYMALHVCILTYLKSVPLFWTTLYIWHGGSSSPYLGRIRRTYLTAEGHKMKQTRLAHNTRLMGTLYSLVLLAASGE